MLLKMAWQTSEHSPTCVVLLDCCDALRGLPCCVQQHGLDLPSHHFNIFLDIKKCSFWNNLGKYFFHIFFNIILTNMGYIERATKSVLVHVPFRLDRKVNANIFNFWGDLLKNVTFKIFEIIRYFWHWHFQCPTFFLLKMISNADI